MIFSHSEYRAYLKATMTENRSPKSGAYSLNAWAKRFGIAKGFLSEVLKGKKNLSQEAALKIARKLELGANETEYFCLLVQFEVTRDRELKQHLLERLNAFRPKAQGAIHNLQLDVFRMVNDWYCLPILELTYLEGFEFNARNVARAFKITPLEAEVAIERLIRLELLEKDARGKYVKVKDNLLVDTASHSVPVQAVQSFHRQMLEKAAESLVLPSSQRVSRSDFLPISAALMPEVKKILDEAGDKILALAKRPAGRDRAAA